MPDDKRKKAGEKRRGSAARFVPDQSSKPGAPAGSKDSEAGRNVVRADASASSTARAELLGARVVNEFPPRKECGSGSAPFFIGGGGRVRPARRAVRPTDLLNPEGPLPDEALWNARALAATRFRLGLEEAKTQIGLIRELASERRLPGLLWGILLSADGAPGASVHMEAELDGAIDTGTRIETITDEEGNFALTLPRRTLPAKDLTLFVQGANGRFKRSLRADQIGRNGFVGSVKVDAALEPLPLSVIGRLQKLLPASGHNGTTPGATEPLRPEIAIGEEGHCLLIFRSDAPIDRFPFSVFIRLVEPRTSIVSPVIQLVPPDPKAISHIPTTDFFPLSENKGVNLKYVDRVPVDQPISVDGFRDQLVGVGDGTHVSSFETVAMAGTLGLGYVVQMAQLWTPRGLALGDLVYSLPLAPGEQQRVAIFERRETTELYESESLEIEEQQRFKELVDTSTEATFTSAFNEAARGGSEFETQSKSELRLYDSRPRPDPRSGHDLRIRPASSWVSPSSATS